MSVVETDLYRRAFTAYALRQPLDNTDRSVLEQARREASLPPGRYPIPPAPDPAPQAESETATARIDGPPTADPTARHQSPRAPLGDGTETR